MIRIQHLPDGEFRLTVNGVPHRLPERGCDLVLTPNTKYQNRVEKNYRSGNQNENETKDAVQ